MAGLRIMNEIITGIVTGVTDMVVFFKELYNDALKPIFELHCPRLDKAIQWKVLVVNWLKPLLS